MRTIKMKSKILKGIGTLALALCMFLSFGVENVSAAYSKYSTYSYDRGALWWNKKYNCTVYKDSAEWFRVWYGNSNVSTGFEYKNNTSIVLSQTNSFSISSQTTATLNSGIDVEAFGIEAGIGGSLSSTCANTWQSSSTTSRTIEKSAPKGYYSYNVCMDEVKLKITGTHKGTIYIYAPSSEAYRAIVYNKDKASYSGVVLY